MSRVSGECYRPRPRTITTPDPARRVHSRTDQSTPRVVDPDPLGTRSHNDDNDSRVRVQLPDPSRHRR